MCVCAGVVYLGVRGCARKRSSSNIKFKYKLTFKTAKLLCHSCGQIKTKGGGIVCVKKANN